MKTFLLSCAASAALFSLSACEEGDGDHHHRHHDHDRETTSTTTTEEATIRQPVVGTTETRTVRTY